MGCPEYWLQTPLWHFVANIGLFIKILDMKWSSSESKHLLAANFHKIAWNDYQRWPVITSQMFVNIWRKVKCFRSSDEKDFILRISISENFFFILERGSERSIYESTVLTFHGKTTNPSVSSSFDQIDVDVWRVCMDSKMSDMLRFYWSAVYLIGFVLPLVAVVVSYKELFQRVRDTE